MIVGAMLHLILTLWLYSFYHKKPAKKWNGMDLITLLLIFSGFILLFPYYMDFMWAFTSR